MKLRARQVEFRDNCVSALDERSNTLGVAPTGAGKTVMLSAISGHYLTAGAKGLIIQHRDELVTQNRRTFQAVNPTISTGLFTADEKNWRGTATFAMIQTLAREANLDTLPTLDFVAVDEGHHAAAPSYQRTLEKALSKNPKLKLLLVTATPNRGDGKALRDVVDNVADQITLRELIEARLLVRPRTFAIDLGVQEALRNAPKRGGDFDPAAVEEILDKEILNAKVVEEWEKVAADRQTVVFCSTVRHAEHVTQTFKAAGYTAALIHGDLSSDERERILAAYDRGEIQIVCNVAVLTEGWDHQPTSCVILLRQSSYQSTMLQMIGRGLRTVDPERYPGVTKDDCIVLDFGTSLITHGALEQDVKLDGRKKKCEGCQASIPSHLKECPLCGHIFEAEQREAKEKGEDEERQTLDDFVMTEVDLLADSPFQYEHLFDGLVSMACAFEAWVAVISYYGRWHAVGGGKAIGARHLADTADRLIALSAADDFMRLHGDKGGAGKTKRWLTQPCTDKQRAYLGLDVFGAMGLTKYRAACQMTWNFNERWIRQTLDGAVRRAA